MSSFISRRTWAVFAVIVSLLIIGDRFGYRRLQCLGLPPSEAALMTAPVSVWIVVTSFSLRRHVVEHGRRVVKAGVVLVALGVVGMTVVIVTHPRPDLH